MGLLRSASLFSAGPVRPDLQSAWGHVGFGGLARFTAAPPFHPNLGSRWPFWAFLGLSRPLEPLGQPTGRLVLPAHGSERKALRSTPNESPGHARQGRIPPLPGPSGPSIFDCQVGYDLVS